MPNRKKKGAKKAGSLERPFASGDDWAQQVFGRKSALEPDSPPRRSALSGILALAASPPTPVVEVEAAAHPQSLKTSSGAETRQLKKSRKKRKARKPALEEKVTAVSSTPQHAAAKPVLDTPQQAVKPEPEEMASTASEEMPGWLRDAADALPSNDDDGGGRPAVPADAASPTPVDWASLSRLLEEKEALHQALLEAQRERASDAALLERMQAERDSEAAAARAMRAERSVLTLRLEAALEEKTALQKAELSAQVKLCNKIQEEDALRSLLEAERHASTALKEEAVLAAADAAASAAAEGAAARKHLVGENATLSNELTRTRLAILAGRPNRTLAAVALQQSGALPPPALRSAQSPQGKAVALASDGSPQSAVAPSPSARLTGKTPKRGLSSRAANGQTPVVVTTPAAKASAARAKSTSKKVLDEVLRLEAAILDKENELSRVCTPEDRAVVRALMG